MDPFTIATIVVKVTGICLSTAKALHDMRSKYSDAPITLVSLCSETTVISASLSYLQTLVCQKQDFGQILDSKPELLHAIDTALIGCMVLFSCLEEETRKIGATSSNTGAISWRGKARVTWNHEKLQELLNGLRGQQLAINLLVQLVQVDSLGEIRQLLSQNRPVMTESIRKIKLLKESHPEVKFPHSVYESDDGFSIRSEDVSIAGNSALEFEFDDLIVNSKVYRQVLASARAKVSRKEGNDRGVIEGDLIDFSDSQTITTVGKKDAIHDLDCLIISENKESTISVPTTSASYSTNDHEPGMVIVSHEDSGRAGTQTSNPPAMRSTESDATALLALEHVGSSSVDNDGHGVIQTDKSNTEKGKKSKFGEYYLGPTVGEGDRSKVKICWKVKGGVEVAIKLIPSKYSLIALSGPNDMVHLRNMYREVAILRHISHPNVIRLHEMVETVKYIGIIFEYASGGELFDYISTHRYLKDNAARRLFAQIVSGLGYLHLKGIAHRNLNLHNLLLDRNRNIIIAGFGSANTFSPEDKLSDEIEYNLSSREYIEREGLDKVYPNGHFRGDLMQTKGGEPYFTAPERMVQSDNLLYTSRKADSWSCGVVLYTMLAGHEPFDDDPANPEGDNMNLLYRYMITVPVCFPDYVTPHARDLLRRILVPDPRKRADLLEIARHSWLAEYAHVVEFITRQELS